jgi:hypothetical protein
MPHMIPQYVRADFFTGEAPHGAVAEPADLFRDVDDFIAATGSARHTAELVRHRFWARLSAPGYLDCTDWHGPFDSIDEARTALGDLYDVDAVTGDDLIHEAEHV